MKRTLPVILCVIMLLSACGMSAEEIAVTMEQAGKEYETGDYTPAQEYIGKLEGSYKKMTDEQKGEYDRLKPLIDYAAENIDAINESFAAVDGYIDRKMYYEAGTELSDISGKYELPPTEQQIFEEKNIVVNDGIRNWKVFSSFKDAETAFNNNDSDTVKKILEEINFDELTEEQKNTYQEWKNKTDALVMLKLSESQCNNKRYSEAKKTLESVQLSLLNEAQKGLYNDIKNKINENTASYSNYIGIWKTNEPDVIIDILSATYSNMKFRFQYHQFDITVSNAKVDGKKVYGKYYEVWDDGVDWENYVVEGTITLDLMENSISLNWSGSENGRQFSNNNFIFKKQ